MDSTRNDHPVTLLLAGFGAFPGVDVNPAEQLVRSFDDAVLGDGVRLERRVVPVEWNRSWRYLETCILRLRPDAVLLVGVHPGAERFRLEMTGHNERVVDRPDAAGRYAEATAIGSGPHTVPALLPLAELQRELGKEGIDFECSSDAGRYLCNETLYLLYLNGASLGVRYFGFVHTPPTNECREGPRCLDVSMSRTAGRIVSAEDLSRLATQTLRCLADAVAQERVTGEPGSAGAKGSMVARASFSG